MRRNTLYKYISRAMVCLMALALLLPMLSPAFATEPTENPEATPAQENTLTTSGSCGPNLTWSFADGTLTISGSGEMTDFPESTKAPWYSLREKILRISLPEGLTSLGDLAFYQCTKVKTLVIPNSVTRIGSYAVSGCSGLELLNLGSGVRRIQEGAFSDCVKLTALWLPESLEYLGHQAFYCCRSITAVTVPENVTWMGMSVFAYCTSLLSAEIRAEIQEVPEYLFFGCDDLSVVTLSDTTTEISDFAFRSCENLGAVYYGGTSMTEEEIRESVSKNIPEFETDGSIAFSPMDNTASSSTITENANGTVTQQSTNVRPGENATVTTTVTNTRPQDTTSGNISSEVVVNVSGESGWQEAGDAVDDALEDINRVVTGTGSTSAPTEITVYIQNDQQISQEFIDNLANREVVITVITQDGSSWRIDTTNMQAGSGAYDLRYDVTMADAALCEELGVGSCFRVSFRSSAMINSEILIRIGENFAMQNATLMTRGKELQRIQSSVVDLNGNAHFYLASVNAETEYYIAINLPDLDEREAIIPEELNNQFGSPVNIQPIQYEITGRESSWGINIQQVTWIMAAVLFVVVLTVGMVMYGLNKRKLRMGYVPDLDEEYEE